MKTSIFLAFCCLLLLSCKKTANFHVKIVNPATGEGYANTTFYVKSEKTGSDGEIINTEATGVTNENGEAVVSSLKISNAKSYYVVPENIENVCYINDVKIYYTDRMTNPNPHFTFEIAPCAYSKLTINNVNCEGSNDLMVLYQGNQISTFDGTFGWQHHGCAFWQTNGQSDIPMGKVYYRWEVTRSGGTTIHYDTVYYAPGILTEYVINY